MPSLFLRGLSHIATSCVCLLLTACAEAPAQSLSSTSTAPPVAVPALAPTAPVAQSLSFSDWCALLRSDAIAAGIDPELFDRAFAGVTPNPDVLAADSRQPEFSRPIWEYLDGALSPLRVAQGRTLRLQHRDTLKEIKKQYRVDREVLLAIWGLASDSGL